MFNKLYNKRTVIYNVQLFVMSQKLNEFKSAIVRQLE